MSKVPKCALSTTTRNAISFMPKCCSHCAGKLGPIPHAESVTLITTNIASWRVKLPVCEWCVGATRFGGGGKWIGSDMVFAVTGIHPAFAEAFVSENLDSHKRPVWSILSG